ncbi:hypothetical protein C8A03DRAFT_38153 [Achaetomium macrosporum]|uniref:Uncharacterized protein n=1 Tax=Achaetomium macrosporum TaxID=79813 RepID=A0AAN7HAQ6_9PEZI|nr:hypothetical protein C8A03DRAFT_38153 [Achaetomium macrosporum]
MCVRRAATSERAPVLGSAQPRSPATRDSTSVTVTEVVTVTKTVSFVVMEAGTVTRMSSVSVVADVLRNRDGHGLRSRLAVWVYGIKRDFGTVYRSNSNRGGCIAEGRDRDSGGLEPAHLHAETHTYPTSPRRPEAYAGYGEATVRAATRFLFFPLREAGPVVCMLALVAATTVYAVVENMLSPLTR